MKIIIGSKSDRKVDSVKKSLENLLKQKVEVVGFDAKSGMPDTPYDKQTFDGAKNRAIYSKDGGKADFYLGLESGLVERYGQVYEEAWCVVISKDGTEYYGYSSGLRLPDYVLSEMKRLNKEHCDVMTILEEKHGRLANDTWGNYSAGMITRENSLQEAVRNTFIQIFAPNHSFYKQKSPTKLG